MNAKLLSKTEEGSHAVDNIFSQIVPLTLAMVLPKTMLKSISLLLHGRPVKHSTIMIVTWGLTIFLVLSMASFVHGYMVGLFEIKFSLSSSGGSSGWMHISVGIFMLYLGVKRLERNLDKDVPSVPKETPDLKTLSIIKVTAKTALIGLKNSSLMVLIIYIFLNGKYSEEESFIVAGLIALTSMVWISMPLAVYYYSGRNKEKMLESLKEWLTENRETLYVFIYLFIGISSLSSGIGEEIPKLLEFVFEEVR